MLCSQPSRPDCGGTGQELWNNFRRAIFASNQRHQGVGSRDYGSFAIRDLS